MCLRRRYDFDGRCDECREVSSQSISLTTCNGAGFRPCPVITDEVWRIVNHSDGYMRVACHHCDPGAQVSQDRLDELKREHGRQVHHWTGVRRDGIPQRPDEPQLEDGDAESEALCSEYYSVNIFQRRGPDAGFPDYEWDDEHFSRDATGTFRTPAAAGSSAYTGGRDGDVRSGASASSQVSAPASDYGTFVGGVSSRQTSLETESSFYREDESSDSSSSDEDEDDHEDRLNYGYGRHPGP
jgi:hypothetical protein